jgi:predicted HicB family RNase H-like nuclease
VTGLERKKTTFYIEKELHSAVRIAAIKMETTLTEFLENALKEKLIKEGFEWHDEEQEKEQS